MKRRTVLPGFLLVCAVIYLGVTWLYRRGDVSWHQRLAITVTTPQGEAQGASVTSIYWHRNDLWKDGARYQLHLQGEAVTVDLGGGHYLFALLNRENDPEYIGRLVRFAVGGQVDYNRSPSFEASLEQIAAAGGIAVKPEMAPLLVTFDDVNDPKSVKRVDPADLAASFGPGFALKSITLTITDEPVTGGRVEAVLGWLNDYYDRRLDGDRFGNADAAYPLANSLASGAFDTEKVQ